MIKEIRQRYNASFTDEKYQAFLKDVNEAFNFPVNFRVAESPLFVPKQLKDELLAACEDVIDFVLRSDIKAITESALQPSVNVPNEDEHTSFLVIDYAVTVGPDGKYLPQLIEFQGFPTMFLYKLMVQEMYRKHFEIPGNFSALFSGLDEQSYLERLRRIILGKHAPENVVLLEIQPLQQNTAIDFVATEVLLGIKPICISEVIKEGRKLFYKKDGVLTPIHRLYNRVIFDELEKRDDLVRQFNMTDDVDVEWVCHPNWYSRLSKFCLPTINSKYVPESRLLSSFESFPTDLENYVLKPLYSFSGSGVVFNVRQEHLDTMPKEEYDVWMLQRKVQYEPVLEAADGGFVKAEIRMIYFWEAGTPRPVAVQNLVRLSRGEMIGVKYNKNKTWVGGTVAFCEL